MGGLEADNGMTELIICSAAGLISGMIGALGLGGGGVLIIYLTVFASVPQTQAQGMNLLFFMPCALVALYFHTKAKLVKWRYAVPMSLIGFVGAIAGCLLAGYLGGDFLRKLFGGYVLALGLFELFKKGQ